MKKKEEFIRIYRQYITRPGAEELLDYLENHSDFFEAPASTRFHMSYEGGLVEHSLNVYECLKAYLERERVRDVYGLQVSDETLAVVSLLHDVCKTNCYQKSFRNVKDENGKWQRVPSYDFSDPMPYGHGEKSVYLIERFMRLKPVEAMAIRWHMGGFDDAAKGGSFAISLAFDRYPLAVKLHMADLESTYLREKGTSDVR